MDSIIKISTNIWLNSLIGLSILIIGSLINIIRAKQQTLPVTLLKQALFTIIACLFGWPVLIYSLLSLTGVTYYNIRQPLDYDKPIQSLSGLKNRLKRKPGIQVGTIMPTSKYELKYNKLPIVFDDDVLSGSTLLSGSSGSGKSTTMTSLMNQAIRDKKPVVFFDFKGETEILDKLKLESSKHGIPYYEFSSRACTFSYDPFINLNATGRVEALVNTRKWDASGADAHYKSSTQLVIQNVIQAYDKHRFQYKETINYLVGLYNFASTTYKPSSSEKDGFLTLCKQLEIILTSKGRDLFYSDKPSFTFERDDQYVICFSFVSANKALANSLSSFIWQDMMDRGTRRHYNPRLLLAVDEFGTLESSTLIKDILEKGRSGGIQTIFSILELNQIALTSGPYFVDSILGTINNFIIHAGAIQSTAKLLAEVQKFENKDYAIMNLQKPYKGQKPTAMLISKFPIVSKKGNQEIFRIIPYIYYSNLEPRDTLQAIKNPPINLKEPVISNPDTEDEEIPEIEDYTTPNHDNFNDFL